MDVFAFQQICIFSIMAVGTMATVAPWLMAKSPASDASTGSKFSYANMGSSGVFLAAGLVHMLPDATEDLSDLDTKLPVASVLVGIGFCLLLVIGQMSNQLPMKQPISFNGSFIGDTGKASTSASPLASTTQAPPHYSEAKVAEPCQTNDEPIAPASPISSTADETLQQPLCQEGAGAEDSARSNWLTALVLWAALSVHSLLAGASSCCDYQTNAWLNDRYSSGG